MNHRNLLRLAATAALLAMLIMTYRAPAQPLAWTELAGPEGGTVVSIATGPGVIYVGMTYGRIFRSTDGGTSWRRTASAPAPLQDVGSLATTSSGDLFAATYDGSVYRSTDQGDSWLQVHTKWQYGARPTLAIGSDDQILLGSDWGSFYRSTDLGSTWATVDSIGDVTTIAITSSNEIYVGATTGWYNGTLYRSTDRGKSWHQVHRRTNSEAITGIVKLDGTLIVGTEGSGVIRSSDDGVTWSPTNDGLSSLHVQRLAKIDSTSLVAITGDGPFISRDTGQHWTRLNWDTSYSLPGTLLSIGDGVLLAGISTRGLVRFTLQTERWEEVNAGLRAQEITSIVPLANGRIVAGTITGGIHTSTDNGASWHLTSAPTEARRPARLVRLASGTLLGLSYLSLLRSTDNGESWSASKVPVDVMSEISVSRSDVAIVAVQNYYQFFVSSDDGKTWRQMVLQGKIRPSQPVTAMVFAANGRLVVGNYAGGEEAGIFVADLLDDTLRFTSFIPGMYVRALAMTPNGVLYSADGARGILTSPDAGETWLPFVTPSDSSISTLLARTSGDLIAGTQQGNVWRLPAGGTQWSRESDGLIQVPISTFATDSSGSILAGTLGGGIFRSGAALSTPEIRQITDLQLFSAAPNPSPGALALQFELARQGRVRIAIIDILGNVVGVEWSRDLDKGIHAVELDLSSLPSGNYTCRIATQQTVLARSITLVR